MRRWSLSIALVLAGLLLLLILNAPVPSPQSADGVRAGATPQSGDRPLRQHVPVDVVEATSAVQPAGDSDPLPAARETQLGPDARPPAPAPRPESATPATVPPGRDDSESAPSDEEIAASPAEVEPRSGLQSRSSDGEESGPGAGASTGEQGSGRDLVAELARAEGLFSSPVSPRDVAAAPTAAGPAAAASPRRRQTLHDDAAELESLLGTDRSPEEKPAVPTGSPRGGDYLVEALDALLPEPVEPTGGHPDRSGTGPGDGAATVPGDEPPGTLAEWRERQDALRDLVRDGRGERVRAAFRLEPQDPGLFLEVCRQYRMDALLVYPPDRIYAIVPAGASIYDKTEVRADLARLDRRYGLSLERIELPWLRELRAQFTATKLIPFDAVEASLLIPKSEANAILGRIVADCRRLGVSLDEISECFGTFVRTAVGSSQIYDYRVTRVVLRDGRTLAAARAST